MRTKFLPSLLLLSWVFKESSTKVNGGGGSKQPGCYVAKSFFKPFITIYWGIHLDPYLRPIIERLLLGEGGAADAETDAKAASPQAAALCDLYEQLKAYSGKKMFPLKTDKKVFF